MIRAYRSQKSRREWLRITQVLVRNQIGAKNLSVMPGDESLCAVEWGMNIVRLRKCNRGEVLPVMINIMRFDPEAGMWSDGRHFLVFFGYFGPFKRMYGLSLLTAFESLVQRD